MCTNINVLTWYINLNKITRGAFQNMRLLIQAVITASAPLHAVKPLHVIQMRTTLCPIINQNTQKWHWTVFLVYFHCPKQLHTKIIFLMLSYISAALLTSFITAYCPSQSLGCASQPCCRSHHLPKVETKVEKFSSVTMPYYRTRMYMCTSCGLSFS